MMQTCNDAYWEHMPQLLARNGDPENPGKPCGRKFDDFDHLTTCPHNGFAPSSDYLTAKAKGLL